MRITYTLSIAINFYTLLDSAPIEKNTRVLYSGLVLLGVALGKLFIKSNTWKNKVFGLTWIYFINRHLINS